MIVLYKLLQAMLIGVVMVFSAMLLIVATLFFVGFIAELFGLTEISARAYSLQKTVWLRVKIWFFRYKDINEAE